MLRKCSTVETERILIRLSRRSHCKASRCTYRSQRRLPLVLHVRLMQQCNNTIQNLPTSKDFERNDNEPEETTKTKTSSFFFVSFSIYFVCFCIPKHDDMFRSRTRIKRINDCILNVTPLRKIEEKFFKTFFFSPKFLLCNPIDNWQNK